MAERQAVPSGALALARAPEGRRFACDVLVVGSGIAGLTAALHCSRDRSVVLVTKGSVRETSTWYAQGGIAGAIGEADSVDLHVADTLVVGQGLCDERVVRAVISEAPEALESLLGFGVRFDLAEGGGVALAREGGHSLPRVLHSGDMTGAAIQEALTQALIARGRIPVRERRFLVDLIVDAAGRCRGALVLDAAGGVLETYAAEAVVLATGGAGQVFPVTTNPAVATGDGIAAAWRAGAEVCDLEFVQFHPTALDSAATPRFLVSEALRGEGAYLIDCDGERFMLGAHPLAELAPRDVVAREIERVMARCGRPHVWLDARHLGEARLRARFPNIWRACAKAGYDLARDLVPVAPAAHYLIGGVRIDLDGRTSIPGLFASGEVAASGLHGANRLASNSLLEGLVISRRIARALDAGADRAPTLTAPIRSLAEEEGVSADAALGEAAAPHAVALDELHAATGAHLGMSRTAEGLRRAIGALAGLSARLEAEVVPPERALAHLELSNLVTIASLMARAALLRTETRGCHSRLDHPERDDEHWRGHVVFERGSAPAWVPVGGAAEAPSGSASDA